MNVPLLPSLKHALATWYSLSLIMTEHEFSADWNVLSRNSEFSVRNVPRMPYKSEILAKYIINNVIILSSNILLFSSLHL